MHQNVVIIAYNWKVNLWLHFFLLYDIKMKTAICLSGELRSIDKCIDGWKEKILPKLGDYDLFYFAWDDDPDKSKLKYLNQLNLGQSAIGLGQQSQGLLGSQIAGLQTLGAGETSQQQAILEAQRQLAQQQAYQPLNIAERYGAGITPLIAGYPGREMTSITPSPSPLQNILGIGSTLAGIYSKFNPAPLFGK